jgi:hypothetical protein
VTQINKTNILPDIILLKKFRLKTLFFPIRYSSMFYTYIGKGLSRSDIAVYNVSQWTNNAHGICNGGQIMSSYNFQRTWQKKALLRLIYVTKDIMNIVPKNGRDIIISRIHHSTSRFYCQEFTIAFSWMRDFNITE